jgi:hypothetical protein
MGLDVILCDEYLQDALDHLQGLCQQGTLLTLF